MPTYRQKLALAKLVDFGGNIGKAMRSAGYSPNTAKTPTKLTLRRGWQELMEQYFSDEIILQKHRELLNTKNMDVQTVARALDMAYKVRGRYRTQAPEQNSRFRHLSLQDIERLSFGPYKLSEDGRVVPIEKNSLAFREYKEKQEFYFRQWQESIQTVV